MIRRRRTVFQRLAVAAAFAALAASLAEGEEGDGWLGERPTPEETGRLEEERERLRALRDALAAAHGDPTPPAWGTTLILPRDAAAEAALAAARLAVERGEHAAAARLLADLAERPGDGLVPAGDGRTLRPARIAVEEIVRGGPPALREAYAGRAEPAARRLVAEAARRRDEARLSDAARRFGAAPSGREARRTLVRLALARDDFEAAAGRFLDAVAAEGEAAAWEEDLLELLFAAAARRRDAPWMRRWIAEASRRGAAHAVWERHAEALAATRAALAAGAPRRAVLAARPVWARSWEEPPPPWPAAAWRDGVPIYPSLTQGRLVVRDGQRLIALSPDDGEILFQGPPARAVYGIAHGPQAYHRVAVAGRRAVASFPDTPPVFDQRIDAVVTLPTQDLLAWDLETGKLAWKAKEAAQEAGSPYPEEWSFPAAPVLGSDATYAAASAFKGLFSSFAVALSPDDGKPLWRAFLCSGQQEMNYFGRPLRESIPSPPALAAGRLVVSTNLGVVAAVDPRDGRILWLFQYDQVPQENQEMRMFDIKPRLSGWVVQPPAALGGLLVVTPTDSPFLYALDAATGRMIWRRDGQGARHVLVDPATETVCLYGSDAAVGLGADDGQMKWRTHLRGGIVRAGCVADACFYLMAGRRLYGLDARTGRLLVLVDDCPAAGSVLVSGRRAYIVSADGVAAFDLVEEQGEPAARGRPAQ